jgi:WD40 repeat protein
MSSLSSLLVSAYFLDNPMPRIEGVDIKARRTLNGHLGKVYSVQWLSDSRQVVSVAQDGRMLIWDIDSMYKVGSINLPSRWVLTCAVSESNHLIASAGLDNICSIFKRDDANLEGKNGPVRQLRYHDGYISCCKFVHDDHILTASGDASIALWDVEREQVVEVFKGHKGDVMCVSVAPDCRTFVSVGCDSTARLWDIRLPGLGGANQTVSVKQIFVGHEGDINAVSFLHNGFSFVTGSEDSTCRLFDVRADRELQAYGPTQGEITTVSCSKSGRLLFAGCEDGNVYTWDTLLGNRLSILSGHDAGVSSIAVSPDGNVLCSASWDTTVKVWV